MKEKDRGFISYFCAVGYCRGRMIACLSILMLRNIFKETQNPVIQEIRFAMAQFQIPTLTWEKYQAAVRDPEKIFDAIREIIPNITPEMFQELTEVPDEDAMGVFVEKYEDVLQETDLWEEFDDAYDVKAEQEEREYRVQKALEYLDGNEDTEDSRRDTKDKVPVLMWDSCSCGDDDRWYGAMIAERVRLAKEYLDMPDLTIKKAKKKLKEAELEQEITVRCGNRAVVGSKQVGYNHFYIDMVNPKRAWVIKCERRDSREFVCYIQTDEYGYVTDEHFLRNMF